jgi:hypothetical protein
MPAAVVAKTLPSNHHPRVVISELSRGYMFIATAIKSADINGFSLRTDTRYDRLYLSVNLPLIWRYTPLS